MLTTKKKSELKGTSKNDKKGDPVLFECSMKIKAKSWIRSQ